MTITKHTLTNLDEDFRKKLLYKSTHRGCKEIDLIVGNFVKNHIDKMSYEELSELEHILSYNDSDIYDWTVKLYEIPLEFQNHTMDKLVTFTKMNFTFKI